MAVGNASLRIDGNSSVRGNSASGAGGGLSFFNNVRITLAGGSKVQNNTARTWAGGGMVVSDNVSAELTDGSSVQRNMAAGCGRGLYAVDRTEVVCTGCIIAHNTVAVLEACALLDDDGASDYVDEEEYDQLVD
jgi:hypothetical protein